MNRPQQFPDVVFFAADAAYLPNAWTAARAAAAEPGRNFDVVLLAEKNSAANIPAPPGCRLLEIELPEYIRSWHRPAHISAFTYARLAAPDLWLGGYRRALYLDSDIRLTGPLAPLFALDLNGAMLAMVEDGGGYIRDAAAREAFSRHRARIGQNPQAPYCNAGVTLIDLARWRAQQCWQHACAYIESHGAALTFLDQDALNFLGRDKTLELSPRWNFQTHYFGRHLEPILTPHILHYADILKPWRDPEWHGLHDRAHAAAFAQMFKASPWPGFVHPGLWRKRGLFPLAWLRRSAALAKARTHRQITGQDIALHLANFKHLAPAISARLHDGIKAGLDAGRYADLTAPERQRWRQYFTARTAPTAA